MSRLRRAAVVDTFDRLDLGVVPAQAWRFVDAESDPTLGVTRFFEALGLDVEAVRRGDADAVERANDLLELLVEIEGAFERLSPAALDRLEQAIFSGDHDRVRTAARVVAAYEEIVRWGEAYPDELRFATMNAFLRDVAGELDDPLSSAPDDAEAARELARSLAALASRFDLALGTQADLRGVLRDRHPDWASWPKASAMRDDMLRFESYAESFRSATLPIDDLDELMRRMEAVNEELEAGLAARERAKGRRSSSGARDRHAGGSAGPRASRMADWEEALIFFGWERGHEPSPDDFKKRRRELEKANHPDTGGSTAAYQNYGQHRDALKRRFSFR